MRLHAFLTPTIVHAQQLTIISAASTPSSPDARPSATAGCCTGTSCPSSPLAACAAPVTSPPRRIRRLASEPDTRVTPVISSYLPRHPFLYARDSCPSAESARDATSVADDTRAPSTRRPIFSTIPITPSDP